MGTQALDGGTGTSLNKKYMGNFVIKNNFPQIRIESSASKFLSVLESLVNYNDGQGRNYDILDEEIYE